ncbi:MAG: Asp-tRNA(Asn)/Glu-tRNA(Gln) amidotransferase subunit GatC [Gemmatimonadota bacterium]
MKIGEQDVRHVANLAELAVDDADVPLLATQLAGIVDFVAQLDAVAADAGTGAVVVGPERLVLRDDVIAPLPLARTPAQMAPAFQQGFFVVPKLGGMAEE